LKIRRGGKPPSHDELPKPTSKRREKTGNERVIWERGGVAEHEKRKKRRGKKKAEP